ncbi:hypothetical protein PR202_gb02397 [Eleusine coracana subsp. coracana]|uniref:Peroxisomal ATPase PEX1 N-terminal C-lobe domain-containing protein n=1 Tax=Eleusine coracana subsp. coracana TaxID=191504 RepID=A0AAV5DZ57_ELECO|nr:hypothetical protein PR202_gb02397 [Eleusine coracana subsp. coracana]
MLDFRVERDQNLSWLCSPISWSTCTYLQTPACRTTHFTAHHIAKVHPDYLKYHDIKWYVLQVAQELAECISLPDGTIAQLSVARSLAKADSVSIEPFSEDDWEILESRADLAEETILKQVGIIYEGMKFPLWLDGHNIVKFVVVSSCPAKTVGMLHSAYLNNLLLATPLCITVFSVSNLIVGYPFNKCFYFSACHSNFTILSIAKHACTSLSFSSTYARN